ncbi:HAD family hydrolase [Leifsonia xyli]|uniref:HAD family hydrolase n=1 Tax=Leifsonia xyli TaxID=1575 RepID=UPI003D66EE40
MANDKRTARLLVVDLDDTLWTWFDAWYKSFRALLDEVERISGIDEATLISDIRPIHQRRGTSEYSWLLDELALLEATCPPGTSVADFYDEALHAQNRARKAATHLYPGVRETLSRLRENGTTVVGYTESLEFWTRWRIHRTDLDGLLTELYSSPDHDSPEGVDPAARRHLPARDYMLEKTVHRHVPAGVIKPDPIILQQIVKDHGVSAGETVYVGDSPMKDIAMAQAVGAIDALAGYGVHSGDPRYALLQQVSHWTDEMVRKEQDNRPGVLPTPSITLATGLSDIFNYVEFEPTKGEHD